MSSSENPFSLEEQVIVITGASSGIGRASAISCNKQGATVVLMARREGELLKTQKLLSNPSKSMIIPIDLFELDNLSVSFDNIVDKFGKITGFVHSAGIESTVPLKILKKQHLQDMFNLNVFSGIELSKYVTKKKYCSNKGASIVFIASVMSRLGQPGKTAYSASKSALISMSKSMALELAPRNIRVNTISPAMVKTELMKEMFANLPDTAIEDIKKMHPMGFGNPEDIANSVVFLMSNASKWITGINLTVDGGYSAR